MSGRKAVKTMREILFRGQRKDNGEWVYGDLLNIGVDYDYAIRTYGGREHGQVNAVDEKTVGQYTGLHDVTKWEQLTKKEQSEWLENHNVDEWNGKKIFEGDVVRITIGDLRKIGTVKYSERAGRVGIIEPDKNWNFSFMQQPLVKQYNIVVIGKIFDDPELLKGAYNA
jgi:hypothetical protein